MATTEIYLRAKKERIWVSKLREMPEGVFELLIKRIAQGDSIRAVAKYCQTVRPEIAFETYRKWLQALAKLVAGYVAENEVAAAGQRAIDIYHKKEKERQEIESQQVEGPPTVQEAEAVKANITTVLREMELSDLLRDAWFIQHRRITKMVATEEKLGFSLPEGPKNIDALATILGLIMKHELSTTSLLRKGGGVPADFDMEKLSPVAQKVAQLDDVDRNLIQQLSHKWLEMIQEGVADAAQAEGLGNNGTGTKDTGK